MTHLDSLHPELFLRFWKRGKECNIDRKAISNMYKHNCGGQSSCTDEPTFNEEASLLIKLEFRQPWISFPSSDRSHSKPEKFVHTLLL
jgi:hypothetical protein